MCKQANTVLDLPYVLEFKPDMSPHWVEYPHWEPELDLYNENDILVHFAAGSPSQRAYESSDGGFFTQSFCKAMKSPKTLPELLKTIR